MNKKYFDMNSQNTFSKWWEELNLITGEKKKEVEFPPWLTLPVHYRSKEYNVFWKKDLLRLTMGGFLAQLSCGHNHIIDEREYYQKDFKVVKISCPKCSTGEVCYFSSAPYVITNIQAPDGY